MHASSSSRSRLSSSKLLCIYLRDKGDLHILGAAADPCIISIIRSTILSNYDPGIRADTEKSRSHLFELYGAPFLDYTKKCLEDVSFLRLTCRLLKQLYDLGFVLKASANFSRSSESTTWLFTRQKVAAADPAVTFCAIDPKGQHYLRLWNINSKPLIQSIGRIIRCCYLPGIEKEAWTGRGNDSHYLFTLYDNPWQCGLRRTSEARLIFVHYLLRLMRSHGYSLYISTCLDKSTDTLIFVKYGNQQHDELDDSSALAFHDRKCIRLIDSSGVLAGQIRETFGHTEFQEAFDNATQVRRFKFEGRPFWCSGKKRVKTCATMCELLSLTLSSGWHLLPSVLISRGSYDKPVLPLAACPPVHTEVACVVLHDAKYIIAVRFPKEAMRVLDWAIRRSWRVRHAGSRSEGMRCWELDGFPWVDRSDQQCIHARALLVAVCDVLLNHGWSLVLSADLTSRFVRRDRSYTCRVDADVLYFAKQVGTHCLTQKLV